ncbi:unnamed protein product [Pelagomonas calceolata]|uniref:MYND-type domain-containing protein n=1 Tax=Pelagomonas calceolata TaxID=35677 RepID=A0A8J2SWH7_9STRA|nr:unnamed protein product [Pelagomonas calceolata]
MLRTQCASCNVQIPLTAPRCGVCKTRYCGRDCQKTHWKGGHKELCPVIKRRGGPEEIYADNNYKEAVVAAVEKCADATKGQTCYICTEALHWKTKEGLVRGCACRGTAGFVHVSCLAEQAKILVAEVEENKLGDKALDERWMRWYACNQCEQWYHGKAGCALGWACWKTYAGRPLETSTRRVEALMVLGNALFMTGGERGGIDPESAKMALKVYEVALAVRLKHYPWDTGNIITLKGNIAGCLSELGRTSEALVARRGIFDQLKQVGGVANPDTLLAGANLTIDMVRVQRIDELDAFLREYELLVTAQCVLGPEHEHTIRLRWAHAHALRVDKSTDAVRAHVEAMEDICRTARRVFGNQHPQTLGYEQGLALARKILQNRLEHPSEFA